MQQRSTFEPHTDEPMMRVINPAGQSIPQTSQAMLVSGDNLLFISGQVAYGAEGVIGSDLETQLNEAFKNLQTVLHEAGATFEHVVRLTIYVVDYDQSMLPTIRSVRGTLRQYGTPAR
jgi:2-iminobutanoate/2-iminopropanoate deaminase